jgi:hypothetical protein
MSLIQLDHTQRQLLTMLGSEINPMSCHEIAAAARASYGGHIEQYVAAVHSLVAAGELRETGVKLCEVQHTAAAAFRVTG